MERGSMSRIWTKGALAAVLAAASLPGAARAQDDGYTFADAEASVPDDPVAALDSDTAALPTRFVARPLTLPSFWIRGDGMALIYRVPDIPFDDDGKYGCVCCKYAEHLKHFMYSSWAIKINGQVRRSDSTVFYD